MNKIIVIDIPFNIDLSIYYPPGNYIHEKFKTAFPIAQTYDWIARRMALFMKYAASSLIHQTTPQFLCLVRHTPESYPVIQYELSKYPPLPSHIQFTSYADQIIDNLMRQYDLLYHVVIDSDNMYSFDFIQALLNFTPHPMTQTIMCQEGYLYDEATKRLATIFHQSPSCYAALFDRITYPLFFKRRLFECHWNAIDYPYEILPGRNYCLVVHEQNIDNSFDEIVNLFNGQIVSSPLYETILTTWKLL